MILKGIIDIDFVNYKKASMVLEFPYCSFKCDKECGMQVCQNSELASAPNVEISNEEIIKRYLDNPVSQAIVMQGLEPFNSVYALYTFIRDFREVSKDDIVIYTGFTEREVYLYVDTLKSYDNIIIKYGRYIPNEKPHKDELLGVYLASSNQYAKKIS